MSNKSNTDSNFENSIDESIYNYLNRPIYKKLTLNILNSIQKNDLIGVIFDNLETKISKFLGEYMSVMMFNKSRQAIYIIWLLEGEVNNGGFNQFFYNSSGRFYKLVPKSLKLIGADKFAELCEKANFIFESENSVITKYQDGTLEGFSKSYQDNPLDVCDNEFFELYKTEKLADLQINYILNNMDDFIDNENLFQKIKNNINNYFKSQ